jgi:hypothetical protein
MGQTQEEVAQNLAERLCWQAARRDDSRVARRLYRKQVIDGVYRLDEGAWLDDFFSCLPQLGVVDGRGDVQGTAVQRELVPVVHYLLRYSLKPLLGSERMPARPALLCSAEALRRLVGFHAQPGRQGGCQRGAAKRPGPRTRGPIGPEALAENSVQVNVRDLEAWCNGVIRALAQAGLCAAQVTGRVEATALETTAQDAGCGQVTRTRKSPDQRGQGHAIAVTVSGWQLSGRIEARTKLPVAATVVPSQEHDTRSLRALVTPARTTVAGDVRRHQVVFDQGFGDGVELGWLDQHESRFGVPAQAPMAVTAEAWAQAAAGEEITAGRRAHIVRPGQGNTARTERLETEVVGIPGLTTDDQDGTPEHGRHHHRRDFQPHPSNAVVVRTWNGHEYGPGGKPVCLTQASGEHPLRPFHADEDRRLIANCWIKESTQPGSVTPPPQNTARAGRVHVLLTVLMFALATAYRRQGEPADTGDEPLGWQRWRRQLLEQTRDQVMVVAQDGYGIVHLAESSLLVGVKLKEVPPGLGTRQELVATYRLTTHG